MHLSSDDGARTISDSDVRPNLNYSKDIARQPP